MALSDYERKMLEELEAQLSSEDPHFADSIAQSESEEPSVAALKFSLRNIVLGILAAVVGLAVVVGGIAVEIIAVAVLGVLIVFAGLWYLISGIKRQETPVSSSASHPQHPSRGGKPSRGADFFARQAEKWDKRSSGQ